MNAKQLACLVLLVGILLAYQLGQSLQNKAVATANEVLAANSEESSLRTQLEAERGTLTDLQRQSKELIDFVAQWEPYFAILEEQQAAETGISMKVREANMLNISQRYEQLAHRFNNKENPSLPTLVRATLVFDDNYAKLLNWMGEMEKIKPTMRVGRVAMSKGSRGDDLRMEMVLEVPLRKK
jgi:hypothetical protein